MRICLLGCAGFIGSHLVDWLLENSEHEIVGTDIESGKIAHVLGHPRFTFHESDIREDRAFTEQLIAMSDVVVDLVAVASPKQYVNDPLEVFELDFMENIHVVKACTEAGTRLVQFSTCEIYGKTWASLVPDSEVAVADLEPRSVAMSESTTSLIVGPIDKPRWIYACSKQLLERVIHAYGRDRGLDYAIIRPFNFVGTRLDFLPSERGGDDSPRVFSHFMNSLIYGTPMRLVDGGSALRCYTYIADAVECIGRVVVDTTGKSSRLAFNVGSPGNEISVRGLAEMMLATYRERFWDGARPLPDIVSVRHEDFYGEGYEDCDRRIPDIDRARELLDWEPRWGLRELVTATMEGFLEAYRERQAEAQPALQTA